METDAMFDMAHIVGWCEMREQNLFSNCYTTVIEILTKGDTDE